jgi:hypothetical protein
MSSKKFTSAAAVGILSILTAQSASAIDITIFDKVPGNSWGSDSRGIFEDDETEPNTQTGQKWDLEAFHLSGSSLSVIGGFNFVSGQDSFACGDIFIDVNGDAVWGTPTSSGGTIKVANSLFNYDYVISFGGRSLSSGYDSNDQTLDGTYKVFSLTGASDVTVTYNDNNESNPWIYYSGGTQVASGSVTQGNYAGTEYSGGTHYELAGINLSFLTADELDGALLKLTMECGNDNLVGRVPHSVPEGGMTAVMLGLGLLGVVGFRRKLEV